MLRAQLEDSRTCRTAYCLGYCDKSPTILTEDASVFYGTSAVKLAAGELSDPPDEEPDIRCLDTEPIVTRRIGIGDFSSLEKASKAGAYSALQSALKHAPERVLKAVEKSGERGRGGAAFPTAVKWRSCADANGTGEAESSTATNSNRVQKYVIANGDEGDPGSFIDRLLLERDPHGVLEGLLLCAYAVGASEGIIFIRSEYPRAQEVMRRAVDEAREAGVLGDHILGSDFSCDVTVFTAMGSYVCGEETALINAIEGYRGEVRIRPPYPTQEGLFGKPTVVNNVETLVNIPIIVKDGAFNYRAIGTDYSSGTIAMCLNRGFRRPGVVEVEFGTTLRQVIDEAGGSATDRPLEAVLMGGPMGSLVFERDWDTPICYGAMKEKGLQLGHGGLIALGEKTDYLKLLEQLLEFMSEESCGKCVPCRIGSRRALNLVREKPLSESRESLRRVFNVMEAGSLCAFGQSMPNTLRQVMVAIGGQS
jgi:NADH-quinone oxidoreductase subunit F